MHRVVIVGALAAIIALAQTHATLVEQKDPAP